MMSKEEISEFKRTHFNLEKRIEQTEHNSALIQLSEVLKELMENIESTHEKEKNLKNPDISIKMKIVKKGFRLYKKLEYFEANVVTEFENDNISQDIGRKFSSITHLIKTNKLDLAKKEFGYFQNLIDLSKEYEKSKEDLEKKDKLLRKEQNRILNLLAEISGLESEIVDLEKASKYEELLKNLEKLETIRTAYLSSLTSKPIIEVIGAVDSIMDFPDLPGKEELEEMKIFFAEYPTLGKYKVSEICELFNYSDNKLSHLCSETSKFKRIILGNRKWFETVHNLKRSNFLAVNDEDEKVLKLYAENTEEAKKIVDQIKILRKDKLSCKEEYEKKKKIEEKKTELSIYSKHDLAQKLEDAKSNLVFLHSAPEEEKKEEKGFLSKLSSFLKI
jgi:hypothetical protein